MMNLIRLASLLFLLGFSYSKQSNDVTLFYVLSSGIDKTQLLRTKVEQELEKSDSKEIFQFISNNGQGIKTSGSNKSKESLKQLSLISPGRPEYMMEIDELNNFVSDKNMFDVVNDQMTNVKMVEICFFIPFVESYDFEDFIEYFIEKYLIVNRICFQNELKKGFEIKIYSNQEVGEQLKNKYNNYEFIQF